MSVHPMPPPRMPRLRVLPPRTPRAHVLALLPLCLLLGACASTGGRADGAAEAPVAGEIPPDAVPATRVAENGDEITEYRVAGQLRVVKVQPRRGPAYYLYDRNGDGRPDEDEGISPVHFKLFEW